MADSVLCKDVKPDWKISSLLPCPKETITPDTHKITVLIPTRSPRENCKLRESTYMLRGCLNGLLNKRRNFLHVDTFADSETQLEEIKQTSGGGKPNTEEREHGGGKHKKPLCTAGGKQKT